MTINIQNKITLSVIIVNYKSEQYLGACMASIRKALQNVTTEFIVVNNDDVAMSISDADVKIINLQENYGFSRANNIGAREARGKYMLFLNPDTLFISGDLMEIIREFEKDDRIGIIGPKLLTEIGKSQEWSAGVDVTLGDLIRNNLGIKKSKKIWESECKLSVSWVTGAALFIKKELWTKLGGFDDNFFMYFEDVDLCKRVRDNGYGVLYWPSVKIRHLGGASSENKKTQKGYFYASQDYYFQKHFGKPTAFIIEVLRKIF